MPLLDFTRVQINTGPKGLPPGFIYQEALDFRDRITTAGGALRDYELVAVNWWVDQYKRWNLWDKMIAMYPLVGGTGTTGSIAAFRQNLISSSYTLTAGAGVLESYCTTSGFKNGGATGTGSTVIFNTGIHDTNTLNRSDKGLSCFLLSNELTAAAYYDMGCYTSDYSNMHIIVINNSGTPALSDYIAGSPITTPVNGARYTGDKLPIVGFWSGSRIGLDTTLCKNGLVMAAGRVAPVAGNNQNIYLNCGYRNTGIATNTSLRTYGSWAVHRGFTSDEEWRRNLIERTFQNMLRRLPAES